MVACHPKYSNSDFGVSLLTTQFVYLAPNDLIRNFNFDSSNIRIAWTHNAWLSTWYVLEYIVVNDELVEGKLSFYQEKIKTYLEQRENKIISDISKISNSYALIKNILTHSAKEYKNSPLPWKGIVYIMHKSRRDGEYTDILNCDTELFQECSKLSDMLQDLSFYGGIYFDVQLQK
jgi:hypothetical protein